jgi:hypothetical protein
MPFGGFRAALRRNSTSGLRFFIGPLIIGINVTEQVMSEPGSMLPGGIVLIDEPTFIGVTTFASNGDVLMTINTRPGGNCAQVIVGLTANQALQLIERLQAHSDACARAVVNGKGGNRFTEPKP